MVRCVLLALLVALLPLASAFSAPGAFAVSRAAAPAISSARRAPPNQEMRPHVAAGWRPPAGGLRLRGLCLRAACGRPDDSVPCVFFSPQFTTRAPLSSQWLTMCRRRRRVGTMPSGRRSAARPTSSASRRPTRRSPTSRGTRSLRVCRSRRAAAAPPRAHESALPLRASLGAPYAVEPALEWHFTSGFSRPQMASRMCVSAVCLSVCVSPLDRSRAGRDEST